MKPVDLKEVFPGTVVMLNGRPGRWLVRSIHTTLMRVERLEAAVDRDEITMARQIDIIAILSQPDDALAALRIAEGRLASICIEAPARDLPTWHEDLHKIRAAIAVLEKPMNQKRRPIYKLTEGQANILAAIRAGRGWQARCYKGESGKWRWGTLDGHALENRRRNLVWMIESGLVSHGGYRYTARGLEALIEFEKRNGEFP